jgi:hypothetical protein
MSECCKNLLKGAVPVTANQLSKLRRYKKTLHQLSTKKLSNKSRRKILQQKGGFLPLLIGPVLGLVSSLIWGAVKSIAGQ